MVRGNAVCVMRPPQSGQYAGSGTSYRSSTCSDTIDGPSSERTAGLSAWWLWVAFQRFRKWRRRLGSAGPRLIKLSLQVIDLMAKPFRFAR